MATSAGWDGTLNAIFDDTDCKLPDSEIGETGRYFDNQAATTNNSIPTFSPPGDCGKFAAGIAYMVMYLVLR